MQKSTIIQDISALSSADVFWWSTFANSMDPDQIKAYTFFFRDKSSLECIKYTCMQQT